MASASVLMLQQQRLLEVAGLPLQAAAAGRQAGRACPLQASTLYFLHSTLGSRSQSSFMG